MAPSPGIHEFIERAKASGASEQSLVGILTARGWPEKEVYEALAAHYERVTGMEIPHRLGTGTAAKDAFFHLLIFSTLAIWTIGLGVLAFTMIDRWLADTLFSAGYYQGYDIYSAAGSMASVLVAFPIYLLVSRAVLHDEGIHPEKLNSPVRKWLTYMALVIAACVIIGDLIAALTYFLRGEITSRFLAKAFVVLVLSGGVFFYYFGGLKRSEESEPHDKWSRNRWMAGVSGVAVVVMLIFGFSYIGSPRSQRLLRADAKRVQDLYQLSDKIHTIWNSNQKLPGHLDELPDMVFADPITRVAYEYRVAEGSHYELCATFAATSEQNESIPRSKAWSHSAGRHCFAIDAAQVPNNPNIYFPN
ncbi:MAG TPA: DUF5671 domain-containing protein [Candidatus Sulfotelmatobacter sp.]|jgi:hypothetical protein